MLEGRRVVRKGVMGSRPGSSSRCTGSKCMVWRHGPLTAVRRCRRCQVSPGRTHRLRTPGATACSIGGRHRWGAGGRKDGDHHSRRRGPELAGSAAPAPGNRAPPCREALAGLRTEERSCSPHHILGALRSVMGGAGGRIFTRRRRLPGHHRPASSSFPLKDGWAGSRSRSFLSQAGCLLLASSFFGCQLSREYWSN